MARLGDDEQDALEKLLGTTEEEDKEEQRLLAELEAESSDEEDGAMVRSGTSGCSRPLLGLTLTPFPSLFCRAQLSAGHLRGGDMRAHTCVPMHLLALTATEHQPVA